MKSDIPQPLSSYDFFSYLAPGFIFLVFIDLFFNLRFILWVKIDIIYGIIVFITTYITGQIITSGSSLLADYLLKLLNSPQYNLFKKEESRGYLSKLFPGYLKSFPKETQDKIIGKSKDLNGESLFNHAFGYVRKNNNYKKRLDIQLNQYTFCRNISFISLLILLINIFIANPFNGSICKTILAITIEILIMVVMLYRYLFFYRRYSAELFTTYMEEK